MLIQSAQRARLEQQVSDVLAHQFGQIEGVQLDEVEVGDSRDPVMVTATIYQSMEVEAVDVEALAEQMAAEIGQPVRLRLLTQPSVQADSGGP